MKKTFIIFLFIWAFANASAQNTFEEFQKKQKEDFNSYKTGVEKDFNDFRDRANAEYAEFMRKSWEEFRSFAGIPVPSSPEPVAPPVVEPDKKPTSDPLPYAEIIPVPPPVRPPQPVAPIPPAPQPVKQRLSFQFYNTECRVALELHQKITLSDLSENRIADAWKQLSNSDYNAVLSDCLTLREQLKTGDWGYFQLVKKLSETQYHSTTSNEAVLLQMYILTQSGYKVRIARADNRLVLLIPFQQSIYEYSFLSIDGTKFYVMDKSLKNSSFAVCNLSFPKEQFFSLQIDALPRLSLALSNAKTFATVRDPQIQATVATNRNLIDFYNNYPITSDWNLYAQASLSETVKQDLYPVLKAVSTGKSQAEAANLLLNFVQFAFKYQTDAQQFGYERPFFGDETFFYPASDCEDRAILYSILVRELLGLEVVLLYYPGHLATAVHFNEAVQGDYLMIDDKKFLFCDPTYLGADIGMAMSEFKQVKAQVVKI
jgi:hypothetical protein